jgi:predicted Zn-dependent peptidase
VQADATAVAVQEILAEFTGIRKTGAVAADELAHAQASLTRGYVRHFETPAHHARGLAEIAAYDLPADSFDRFVPAIAAITPKTSAACARALFRRACVVAVGDAASCRGPLEALGLPISDYEPEF